jgi:Amt family ammonium transporter
MIWTVLFGIAFAFFKIQNAVMKGGIRPSAEMELAGMDIPEMGALAYPEFDTVDLVPGQDNGVVTSTRQAPTEEASV